MIVVAYCFKVVAGSKASLPTVFWSGVAALLILAIARPTVGVDHHLRRLLAFSLILTAIAHLLVGGPADPASIGIDLILIIGSTVTVLATKRRKVERGEPDIHQAVPSAG